MHSTPQVQEKDERERESAADAMTLQSAFYSVSIVQSSLASPAKRSLLRPIRAQVEPSEKSVEIMRKFSEQYARRSGTYFCVDKTVTSVVIKGLADHKDSLGAPLCPCRHYDDKAAEVGQGFWNCPCVPMRERTIIYPKSRQSTHKSHLLLQTQEDDWVINLKNGESWNSYTNRRRGENGC